MSTEITQLTPPFPFFIRGDTLQFPIKITQKILVPDWEANSSISENDYVKGTVDPTVYFQCTTAGTTGVDEPDWSTALDINDTLTDGDVEWTNAGELVLSNIVDIAIQPVSIVGWVLSFTAKTNISDLDTDAQAQYDYAFPDNSDTQKGMDVITIPASAMLGLIPGKVHVDIQLEIPSTLEPIIKTFGLGKVTVYGDSTRRVPNGD